MFGGSWGASSAPLLTPRRAFHDGHSAAAAWRFGLPLAFDGSGGVNMADAGPGTSWGEAGGRFAAARPRLALMASYLPDEASAKDRDSRPPPDPSRRSLGRSPPRGATGGVWDDFCAKWFLENPGSGHPERLPGIDGSNQEADGWIWLASLPPMPARMPQKLTPRAACGWPAAIHREQLHRNRRKPGLSKRPTPTLQGGSLACARNWTRLTRRLNNPSAATRSDSRN